MISKFRIQKNNLRFFYYRYKDSPYFSLAIIGIVILVCVTIFFQIVIPQIHNWFSISEEAARTRGRIEIINKNITFMKNLDPIILDNQVDVTTNAIPIDKDFGAIVAAISDSAINAGVILDDFTFQIGKVASPEGQPNIFGQKELSFVKLALVLTGDFSGVNSFLKQVQQKLPLSEVTDVDGDIQSTTVTIQFYQKKFPVIVFKDDVPIFPISSVQQAFIDKLSAWLPAVPQEEEVGSESAGSIPLF